ncbi:MAG: SIMPL domain-containing protein, partial [Spirochaetota bacterium]
MAFALLVIGAGLVFAGGAGETGAGGGPTTLTVTGVGTVVGVPDTAVFSVGVQVVGTSPGDVLNESRARSESVQEALRNLGIRERNIQTTHYNMHTERYPTGPDQRPTEMRYVATTGLRIDLTDLDRLDEVFSTATSAGATELWGIQFGVSDSAARHDEAR